MRDSARKQVECGSAARNEGRVHPLIKGGQSAPAFDSQTEEVDVGEIFRWRRRGKASGITEAQIIRPELMARSGEQASQHAAGFAESAQGAGVSWVSENSEECILREGAGRPTARDRVVMEKVQSSGFMIVSGISQSDEDAGV